MAQTVGEGDSSLSRAWRLSSNANHVGVFFGLVSAYSRNDVHGTTQRFDTDAGLVSTDDDRALGDD
jgi:hypothetical protein